MQILHVIPLARSLETEILSYFSVKKVTPGTMVTVPLRKSQVEALVVNSFEVTDLKSEVKRAGYQLRNVTTIHKGEIFSSGFLSAADIIKNFYATTTGKVLDQMTPKFLLKDIATYTRPSFESSVQQVFSSRILQRPLDERIDYYRTLVREKMFHDQSLQIICPTREHCHKIYESIKKNNQDQCFLLHGGMTKKKYNEVYTSLKSLEKTSIVISTARFIDIAQHKKSTIIIERESSDYYRTINYPFLDMRLFLYEYSKAQNLECIWADSILRPETWYQHEQGLFDAIEPINRKIFKPGDVRLISQHLKPEGLQTDSERHAELTQKKGFSPIAKETEDYIRKGIMQHEKIFLYVHKKSLAPTIVCQNCGNIARSSSSGHPFSLYIQKNKKTLIKERVFICHMTGETIPAFDTCQFCKSWNLISMGIGTENVKEALENLFPNTPIDILDSVHTKTKKRIKEVITSFESSNTSRIIVGTTLALEHLEIIDRSVLVSLDSYFARMSYSIHPQVLSLISNVLEKTQHGIYLQSRNIIEESLPILSTGLYSDYITSELQERKDFNYPPYQTLCVVKRSIKKEEMKKHYNVLHTLFKSYDPNIMLRPGLKKGWLEIVVIMQLDLALWNMNTQDRLLKEIIGSFDRRTTVLINPKDLLS